LLLVVRHQAAFPVQAVRFFVRDRGFVNRRDNQHSAINARARFQTLGDFPDKRNSTNAIDDSFHGQVMTPCHSNAEAASIQKALLFDSTAKCNNAGVCFCEAGKYFDGRKCLDLVGR
jgi:hypothetical protein